MNNIDTSSRCPSCVAATVLDGGLAALEDGTSSKGLIVTNASVVTDDIRVVELDVSTRCIFCEHQWVSIAVSNPNSGFVAEFGNGLVT